MEKGEHPSQSCLTSPTPLGNDFLKKMEKNKRSFAQRNGKFIKQNETYQGDTTNRDNFIPESEPAEIVMS